MNLRFQLTCSTTPCEFGTNMIVGPEDAGTKFIDGVRVYIDLNPGRLLANKMRTHTEQTEHKTFQVVTYL